MTSTESLKAKRVQKVYKMRDGRPTSWPHYRSGRYEVIDGGGFIGLYFHRDQGDKLGDDSVGFIPADIPKVIKLLQKAYATRKWYVNSVPPKWLVEKGRREARNIKA